MIEQVPKRQSVSLAHRPPTGLCWQMPLMQLSVQQSSLRTQDSPADLEQAHWLPRSKVRQLPLQQAAVPQALPSSMQQAPLTQLSPLVQAGSQTPVERHWSPDGAKPGSQAMPHCTPSQVAWPCAGTEQGAQAVPQVSTLASVTHSLMPQRWKVGLQ
jgi:hypothetical protein